MLSARRLGRVVSVSSSARRSVIWVCGGDGYPPDRVLAGLTEAGAAVATVHLRGGPLDHRPDLLTIARRLGPVLVVDSVFEIATLAPRLGRAWRATPVLALSDDILVGAARLGNALGWTGLDARLLDRVRHKFRARRLFADAGLDGPPFALIRTPGDVGAALRHVGVPGVVKPVYGAGSCWVFRIDDPADLEPLLSASWSEMSRDDYVVRSQMSTDTAFVYEGLLVGTGRWSGAAPDQESPLADYCSVEGIVSAGEIGILVAERVVRAIGMVSGAFHIELKLTAAGPVVIEANPRPGGPVPHMWERLTGHNFAGAYLQALYGDGSAFRAPLAGACGEHLIYPPGEQPGRIEGVTGLEQLSRLPGVDAVDQWLSPGDLVNPHEGDYSAVARAWSWSGTPVGVTANDQRIRECVQVDLVPATPVAREPSPELFVDILERAV
jgi:hypothetical protein